MIPMLSIVARSSGTGKTTLMERLIAELVRKKWRVGAIKNGAHHLELDYPGKDSWRFSQAGAWSVGIISADRAALIQNTTERCRPEELAAAMKNIDLILVEGYKEGHIPKIEVVRREMGEQPLFPSEELVAVVTDMGELTKEIPCFAFEQVPELADFIEERFIQKKLSLDQLSHFDIKGRVRMVDVTEKPATDREAVARGEILMERSTLELVKAGRMSKGDVLAVAQVAAVMGVKETSRLIPMCHPLMITGVTVDFRVKEDIAGIEVEVTVRTSGQTGVEMEALTGVNTALLTIYDMCKAVDKSMVMGRIRLMEKKGGRSGHFVRREA